METGCGSEGTQATSGSRVSTEGGALIRVGERLTYGVMTQQIEKSKNLNRLQPSSANERYPTEPAWRGVGGGRGKEEKVIRRRTTTRKVMMEIHSTVVALPRWIHSTLVTRRGCCMPGTRTLRDLTHSSSLVSPCLHQTARGFSVKLLRPGVSVRELPLAGAMRATL
jgi:hypothetical protein